MTTLRRALFVRERAAGWVLAIPVPAAEGEFPLNQASFHKRVDNITQIQTDDSPIRPILPAYRGETVPEGPPIEIQARQLHPSRYAAVARQLNRAERHGKAGCLHNGARLTPYAEFVALVPLRWNDAIDDYARTRVICPDFGRRSGSLGFERRTCNRIGAQNQSRDSLDSASSDGPACWILIG